MTSDLFDGVIYHISETVPSDQREQLDKVLVNHGASASKGVDDPDLTHFITPSLPLEAFVEVTPKEFKVHTVTPYWVERSVVLGKLQDAEYYSSDPAYLFSGVVAAAADLSQSDCELISAAITALGGQWRTALTRDVTHLFALASGGVKYDTAIHYREQMNVCVLVPHWFDDTVRLGIRDLPTRSYEWPEPRVFGKRPEGRTTQEDIDYEPPMERIRLYDTASLPASEQRKVKPAQRNIWNGKRLLLGLSLDLSDPQRKALHADIRRQGGEVVELSPSNVSTPEERADEELEKLDEADIFVTRYRSGAAYAKAYSQEKTIGTLAWLWYVRASGTLTRPAEQLLHYPVPDFPASGFEKEVITVTNYTGKDREYLKKLITLMGGEFTASMSADKNTAVIAAYLAGTKTDKATSWSIPIVNHTWVEDCFVQWRKLTPATEKYIKFPPGVDFSVLLAKRGLGKIVWEPGQLEEMMLSMERNANEAMDIDTSSPKPVQATRTSPRRPRNGIRGQGAEAGLVPTGTLQSVGEVEKAIEMEETGATHDERMDVDADKSNQAMDVDEPVSPVVTKRGPPTRKLVRRFSRKTDDEAEPKVEPAEAKTPSPKRSARTYGSAKAKRIQHDDPPESPSPVKKPLSMRRKPAARAQEPDESSDDDVPKTRPKAKEKGKAPPPTRTTKRKVADVGSDSDSDSPPEYDDARSILADLIPNKKGKDRAPPSPAKSRKPPQRVDSIQEPSVEDVRGSSPSRRREKSADTRPGAKVSPMKVGPPRKASKSSVPAATPAGRKPKKAPPAPAPAAPVNAEAGPSRATTSASPSKVERTPLRRSAATKAAQKLHDVIMPDVVSFQKELKSGTVRGLHERDGKVEDASATKGKGKKRVSVGSAGPESEDEEEMPDKKKQKRDEVVSTSVKGKKGRKSAGNEEQPSEKSKSKKGTTVADTSSVDVRVLTTQLTLGDDVIKALTRLGVKFVTKPAECTHLLVRSVVRTEKFLCAMAVAPHVLTEKWATMSAASRRLLPEDQFIVKDEETEERYNFKLVEAVERAKENKGKLFAGIQFYVTPKVPVDTKLLRNVVTANGGQLMNQSPTMRILANHENRKVISCAEDVSIWRPLAEHHAIYTQELILTSTLMQDVEWDDIAFQVPGSY